MAAEGYTRVRPDKFGPSTADSRYVPDYLKNAYDHEFMGAGHRMPILPAVNRAWKTAVLPLSPKWHIGNVVGNLFMATVFGGTTPLQLIAQLGDARQMVKEGILNDSSQARLYTSNMTRGELGRGLVGQHGEIIGPHTNPSMLTPKGFIQASYRANSFIDDVTRTAVYLSKIDKGLSPEIAVRESLNAMGDFTRMTPFERNTIREIIPFYAWMRHVTQAAIRLPIEHPMRAAWMIALANEYGDPQGDLPVRAPCRQRQHPARQHESTERRGLQVSVQPARPRSRRVSGHQGACRGRPGPRYVAPGDEADRYTPA
jgi:hypothetical protein